MAASPRRTCDARLLVFVLSTLGWLAAPNALFAYKLVDDFTETSDSGLYPIVETFPVTDFLTTDAPLSTTIGEARTIGAIPGPTLPAPNPLPSDISMTVGLDTAQGTLTSVASTDSTTWLILIWTSSELDPMNADISGNSELVIDYLAASTDLSLTVTLNNFEDGTSNTVAASEGSFVLAPGVDGQLRIGLNEISDPVQVPLQPPGTFYPPVDLTSIDGILFDMQSTVLGAQLILDQVAFVPEPGSATILLVGLITACFGPRSMFRRGARR